MWWLRYAKVQNGYFLNQLDQEHIVAPHREYLAFCNQIHLARVVSEDYLARQLGDPLKRGLRGQLHSNFNPTDHIEQAVANAREVAMALLKGLGISQASLMLAADTLRKAAASLVHAELTMLHHDGEILRCMMTR